MKRKVAINEAIMPIIKGSITLFTRYPLAKMGFTGFHLARYSLG
jgi:hypothetical protein